jgi:hypothetical protein
LSASLQRAAREEIKVFWFFFSKKNLLSFFCHRRKTRLEAGARTLYTTAFRAPGRYRGRHSFVQRPLP